MRSYHQNEYLSYSRQRQKQLLPNVNNINKKLPQSKHNSSLKKIIPQKQHYNINNQSNHHSQIKQYNSVFPKLMFKSKQYSFNHNLSKKTHQNNNSLIHNPLKNNKNFKKRQKLYTEGVSENYSDKQIQESFISLTNHVINQENDLDDNTMINFRKKIEQNKIIIKQEIQKKNKENLSMSKRQSSLMKKKRINSQKIIQYSPQEHKSKRTIEAESNSLMPTPNSNRAQAYLNVKQDKVNLHSRKQSKNYRQRRMKTQISAHNHQQEKSIGSEKKISVQNQGLFSHLQVILEDKVKPEKEKKQFQQKKIHSLLEKLNKLKKDKNYSAFQHHDSLPSDDLLTSSFKKLKRETNYQDWNKLDFSSTSQVTYRKSSFEDELRKISQYTDRNDASLQKYLHTRKQLLKYGFQVPNPNLKKGK